MGLFVHSVSELPRHVGRGYYLYILDYYNWNEPIGNTLRDNMSQIGDFCSKNDAVVISGFPNSHFYSEVLSWQGINGESTESILPAILITTLEPAYFIERHNKNLSGEVCPNNEMIFLKIGEICKTPSDVTKLLEKLFTDISSKKKIVDFEVSKELKKGKGKALIDAIILQPNFSGVGIDIKKLFNI